MKNRCRKRVTEIMPSNSQAPKLVVRHSTQFACTPSRMRTIRSSRGCSPAPLRLRRRASYPHVASSSSKGNHARDRTSDTLRALRRSVQAEQQAQRVDGKVGKRARGELTTRAAHRAHRCATMTPSSSTRRAYHRCARGWRRGRVICPVRLPPKNSSSADASRIPARRQWPQTDAWQTHCCWQQSVTNERAAQCLWTLPTENQRSKQTTERPAGKSTEDRGVPSREARGARPLARPAPAAEALRRSAGESATQGRPLT
eukprot:538156-Prymnesium_polylepis.1